MAFVAPMLPLPTWRRSTPFNQRHIMKPKGTAPSR